MYPTRIHSQPLRRLGGREAYLAKGGVLGGGPGQRARSSRDCRLHRETATYQGRRFSRRQISRAGTFSRDGSCP